LERENAAGFNLINTDNAKLRQLRFQQRVLPEFFCCEFG